MEGETRKVAVLYCRVSHTKQRNVGDGLQSQEHRCRQYAADRGYEVEAVFSDDVTGGGDFMNRPGMAAMLSHLHKKSNQGRVVVFDDLKRFARDTMFHLQLRQVMAAHNATVECPNFRFEDTPEGRFIETVIAAQGELERLQNKRQTIQKMKARVERGYYVFARPIGYRYKTVAGHGKLLVRDEPLSSIIQEGLEGYASGRFELQAEVKRFFEAQPAFPKNRKGIVINQKVNDILTRPVYAGLVAAPNWGISVRKGHHEPLISYETFRKIQDRLAGNAKTPARKDINIDFPLRGFVLCGDCSTPLTACWSRGSHKSYPYYLCPTRGCESYGKSIRRADLEGAFDRLLGSLRPSESLYSAARATFKYAWDYRLAMGEELSASFKSELSKVERQAERFLDKIAEVDEPSLMSAYESRIRRLEEQKIELNEKIANCGRPVRDFDGTLRTALDFLGNPQLLWHSERLEDKRTVLKLAFGERLEYVRNEGFRTPETTLPFKVLADFQAGRNKMAHPERFERPTPRFVDWEGHKSRGFA